MKTQEQLKREAKLDALKLLPFLRRPDVFIRSIQGGQYEAIRPGDWTSFESQPIKSATFQVLLEDGDIGPVKGPKERWKSTK